MLCCVCTQSCSWVLSLVAHVFFAHRASSKATSLISYRVIKATSIKCLQMPWCAAVTVVTIPSHHWGTVDVLREEMLFIRNQMEDQLWSPAQSSPSKDTLRECLFLWYAFLCFHGLENFDIFYICHNNIHGNDFLDSTVQNLQFACYTEYVVVVLFLLPHKFGRDLNVVERIFVWYKTYCEWTMPHILLLSLLCVYIHMY